MERPLGSDRISQRCPPQRVAGLSPCLLKAKRSVRRDELIEAEEGLLWQRHAEAVAKRLLSAGECHKRMCAVLLVAKISRGGQEEYTGMLSKRFHGAQVQNLAQ
eukprot:3941102-Rhodomonas_salina.3